MRVTQNVIFNTYVNDFMRRQESIYEVQRQLSSGKRVTSSSDDPIAARDILSSKSLMETFGQYERNIDSALNYLNTVEGSLADAKDVLAKLRELAAEQASALNDAATRNNTAIVVNNLFDQLVNLGNTNYDGKYIFSGYETSTAAFTTAGVYQGDANKYQVKLSSTSNITVGINGGEVFSGTAGGVDIFQSITDFVTALQANDSTGIMTAIGTLETAYDQVTNAVADIGGKVVRLQSANSDYSKVKSDLKMSISNLEDADLTKVITELKLGQVAIEASMSSAGKVFNMNIFNYL